MSPPYHWSFLSAKQQAYGHVSHMLAWSLSSAGQQATEFEEGVLGKAGKEHIRNVVRSENKGHRQSILGTSTILPRERLHTSSTSRGRTDHYSIIPLSLCSTTPLVYPNAAKGHAASRLFSNDR
eukprot:3398765-Pleurochrysis_carterae.AAC.3